MDTFELVRSVSLTGNKPVIGGGSPISLVHAQSGFVNGTAIPFDISGSGYQANDVMLIHAHGDRTGAAISISGPPSVVEHLDDNSSVGRARRFGFSTRVLTASEVNPQVDFSASDFWGATLSIWRGVDTTNVLDNGFTQLHDDGTVAGSTRTRGTPPGITTLNPNSALICMGGWTHAEITSILAPAGTTLAASFASSSEVGENHNNVGLAYIADAGAAGAKTFTEWLNASSAQANTAYSQITTALRAA